MTASGVEPTFGALEGRVLTLFGEGKLDAALDLTRLTAERFPDRLAYTAFWSACILAVKGDPERALHALTAAVDRSEVWWGRELLHEDPDLQTLRPLAGFDALVDECERRARDARASAVVEWIVLDPDPVRFDAAALVVLHGRTGNLADSSEAWRAGPDAGITTVVLQSSQMVAQGMYCWDDFSVAARDVESGLRRALGGDQGDLDVALGGFSQGGGVAARVALARPLPQVRGFVAVAPGLLRAGVTVDDIVPLLPGAAGAHVAGWIVAGEDDERYRPAAERLYWEMEQAGVSGSITVNARVGHEFPPHFDLSLAWMLPMLLGRTSSISP